MRIHAQHPAGWLQQGSACRNQTEPAAPSSQEGNASSAAPASIDMADPNPNDGGHAWGAIVNRLPGLAKALQALERSPSVGSPILGRLLGIDELWTWRLQGFR